MSRSYFDDFETENTTVSVGVDDPSSILSPLPSTFDIPAGSGSFEIPLDVSDVGAASITFVSGTQTLECSITGLSASQHGVIAPDDCQVYLESGGPGLLAIDLTHPFFTPREFTVQVNSGTALSFPASTVVCSRPVDRVLIPIDRNGLGVVNVTISMVGGNSVTFDVEVVDDD